jgi:hypothetical protein
MIKIEIDNAVLLIDSDKPDKYGTAIWAGDYQALAKWLPNQYGMFGHHVGDNPAPMDVIHALIMAKKKYQVVEGKEILDIPITPLPDGAIG